jgi:hypothetical protein
MNKENKAPNPSEVGEAVLQELNRATYAYEMTLSTLIQMAHILRRLMDSDMLNYCKETGEDELWKEGWHWFAMADTLLHEVQLPTLDNNQEQALVQGLSETERYKDHKVSADE